MLALPRLQAPQMDSPSFEGMNFILSHPPSIIVPQGYAPLTFHPARAPPGAATTQESPHRLMTIAPTEVVPHIDDVFCVGLEHFPLS